MGPLVPTIEASRRLDRPPRTVRRWIADGSLAGQRIGKIWAAEEGAVAALEQDRRQEGAESR